AIGVELVHEPQVLLRMIQRQDGHYVSIVASVAWIAAIRIRPSISTFGRWMIVLWSPGTVSTSTGPSANDPQPNAGSPKAGCRARGRSDRPGSSARHTSSCPVYRRGRGRAAGPPPPPL